MWSEKIKNKLKILALFQLVLLTAIGCGGGGGGGSKKVELTFWGTFETSKNMKVFMDAFKKAHPSVTINYTEKNYANYEKDLLNAWANQSGPDVFMIHNDWLPKYQEQLLPASDKVMPLKEYKDTFIDVAVRDFSSKGQIYGMPLYVDSLALYYNKDILGSARIATPPKTWEELRSHVKMITQSDPSGFFTRSGIALGTTHNLNLVSDIFYLLMLQAGVTPYLPDNSQSTLDLSVKKPSGEKVNPTKEAIKFFLSFSDPASNFYTWNSKSNYSVDAFAKGELAYLYGYSFTRSAIDKKAPNLNYDIAPVPQPSLDQNLVNYANYWGNVVSKHSKNQSAAWSFVKFMAKKENLNAYYAVHKLPSSRKDIIQTQINNPEIGVFASANLTARSLYKKEAVETDQIIIDMLEDIVRGNVSVEAAITKATQRINLILKKK